MSSFDTSKLEKTGWRFFRDCKEIGCPDHNPYTNRCTKHDNQNSEMCYEYPWSEVGMVFTYNCGYQRDVFRKYMDMYFKKSIELMRGKNE